LATLWCDIDLQDLRRLRADLPHR